MTLLTKDQPLQPVDTVDAPLVVQFDPVLPSFTFDLSDSWDPGF